MGSVEEQRVGVRSRRNRASTRFEVWPPGSAAISGSVTPGEVDDVGLGGGAHPADVERRDARAAPARSAARCGDERRAIGAHLSALRVPPRATSTTPRPSASADARGRRGRVSRARLASDRGVGERRHDRHHEPRVRHPVAADDHDRARRARPPRATMASARRLRARGPRGASSEQRHQGHDAGGARVREPVREVARLREERERRRAAPHQRAHERAEREGARARRSRRARDARGRRRRARRGAQARRPSATRPRRHLGPERRREPGQERGRRAGGRHAERRERRERRRQRGLHPAHRVRRDRDRERQRRQRRRPRPRRRRATRPIARPSAAPVATHATRPSSLRPRQHREGVAPARAARGRAAREAASRRRSTARPR